MTMTITGDAIDVAVDTLAYIKTNPDQWHQRSWGSCFAHHFARLDPMAETVAVRACDCGCGLDVWAVTSRDGRTASLPGWFDERLGDGASAMTAGDRTIEELEAGVVALKEGSDVEGAMMRARLLPLLNTGGEA